MNLVIGGSSCVEFSVSEYERINLLFLSRFLFNSNTFASKIKSEPDDVPAHISAPISTSEVIVAASGVTTFFPEKRLTFFENSKFGGIHIIASKLVILNSGK